MWVEIEGAKHAVSGAREDLQLDAFSRHARMLFETMGEGLVICEAIRDHAGRVVDYWIRDANPIFLQRSAEGLDAVGRRLLDMRPTTSSWWFERCAEALAGRDVRFEFQDPLSGRWYDAHMRGLSGDEFSQFFMDITHRKAAVEQQRALLGELNHRVKNNLAIVTAILELQARDASDEVRAHLAQAVSRVRTVGELHNMLYQQDSPDDVDLRDYLAALCGRLEQALSEARGIRLEVACDPTRVSAGEAVSIGLIINELVTNAAKHAFPGRGDGQVQVRLAATADGLGLWVRDDGVGFAPDNADQGLRMVRALAAGLQGEVRVRPGQGGEVEVRGLKLRASD